MSNTYIKKYDVGQIKLDLPYANYIHELPLLSFGDVQHTINLSLVYNRKNNAENAFNIANGFKLNLQKRLIIDGETISYQDENGKIIALTQYGDVYTFQDDSQRILRRIEQVPSIILPPNPGSGIIEVQPVALYDYEVEYPDFSKENYDPWGRIIAVYDKYGNNPFLTYNYNASGQLISIVYRGTKTISFDYVSDRLKSITYGESCTREFNYNDNGTLSTLEDYSGVEYKFTVSATDFLVQATDANDDNAPVINSVSARISSNDKTITVSDNHGNSAVYKFHNSIGSSTLNQMVDIIDTNGVQTRAQFEGKKIMYSYEVKNGEPQFGSESANGKFLGSVSLYNTQGASENNKASGMQHLNDGVSMSYSENNGKWNTDVTTYADEVGYYTISGWVKSNSNNISGTSFTVARSQSDHITSFYVGFPKTNQWVYFSQIINALPTELYVFSNDNNGITMRDFRVTFQEAGALADEGASHIVLSEAVLFRGSNEISFKDIDFYYSVNNNTAIEGVTISDIMRYKLRKKKYGVCNEIYYNNGKNVITGTTDLKVFYNNNYVSISDFDLGIKVYFNDKVSLTRINVDEANPSSNIVKTQTVGDDMVSTETLNSKLDNKETTSAGVKVSYQYDYDTEEYQSTGRGLIFKQTTMPITDADDKNTIVKQYNYDAGLTKLISTVDEFGNITSYTTDDTWGVVTAVTLPDGSVITDTYDDDRSVLMKKAFDNNETRKNVFGYIDGRVISITGGALSYGFGYNTDNGELASVSKNGAGVEHHAYTENIDESTLEKTGETTVVSKYPTESGALHTETKLFDKYGRLKSVDGVLSNVYDLNPYFFYLEDNLIHKTMEDYDRTEDGELTHSFPSADGKDALLSEVTDSLANDTTKYGYDNGKLTAAVTYNNSDSVLRQETFVYDDIGRVTKDRYIYEIMNPQTTEHEIGYATAVDSPTPDNRISSYTYKLNGNVKAQTANEYDDYKRIKQKTYTVGGKVFTKGIEYTKTRATSVEDKCVNTTIANTAYGYDEMGRINSINNGNPITYKYDAYGQLVRENNKILDKSFQYVYNNIGNIESVKTYAYTSNDTELSGTPIKTETFTYSADKLTAVNGSSLTYNSNGGVSSYDGYSYTWTRGKLANISKGKPKTGMYNYVFHYNALGQRIDRGFSRWAGTSGITSIQTGEVTYSTKQYRYDQSGRLIAELINETRYGEGEVSKSLKYLYDESGIIGVQYTNGANTNTYYYLRNLQGDVIGIYNTSGAKVVGYTYDAWGNCTIDSSTTNYELAHDNPIRYRGYYYDEDTNLYYLNARYYYPEWRRFISPDDTAYIDPETPNGLNLYCYCNNDPINYCDPSGHAWETILDILSIGWSIYDLFKNPSLENVGWLALDIGFAIVPFLTGSNLIKAASKLDEVAYVGKGVNRLDDLYDTIVLGNDMNRVMDRAWDIGATFYGGYGPLNALGALHDFNSATDAMKYAGTLDNVRFIIDKFNDGYKFVHVGSDGRGFFRMMKSAYGTELKVLYRLKYGNKLHKLWWIANAGRRIVW